MEVLQDTVQAKTSLKYAPTTIKWAQVWSLVALVAAVNISWVAYHNYQPKLLEKFAMPNLAVFLAVAKGVVLLIIPPAAGYLADLARQKNGNQMPIVVLGISLAAMVFMSVAFSINVNPFETAPWLLPVMIVLWLISMNIFHSPAVSTVELFVPAGRLPQVVAIMAIVKELIDATEPVIVDIIDFFGPTATFCLGGVLVAATGWALRVNTAKLPPGSGQLAAGEQDRKSDFLTVLLLGLGFGSAIGVLLNVFPAWIGAKLGGGDSQGNLVVAGILVLAALISMPVSRRIQKGSLRKAFAWSMAAVTVLIAAVYFCPPNIYLLSALGIVFAFSFCVLSVSALPLAFRKLAVRQKVLGIGIFFCGLELPDSIFDLLEVL